METALGDIRVLDLTTEMGVFCTKLLADLGAEVIRIEPTSGDPLRRMSPFVEDIPDPEKSLHFFHFNTNKKSITLNIETAEGRDIFLKLVKTADVVVESFPVGYLDSIGLGYSTLSKINSRLILTSISAFGQTGPYKNFKGNDMVGVAIGGLMYLGGFPSSAPNYPGAFQAYNLVGTDAAVGTLAAYYYRDLTGEGQMVDVSMQEAVANGIEYAMVLYAAQKQIRKRTGRQVYRGWNELFPCKDGYVMCSPFGGREWRKIMEWADSEGMAADLLEEPRFGEVLDIMAHRQMDRGVSSKKVDPRMLKEYPEEIKHIEQVWEEFLMTHTKQELYENCQRQGIRLMPLYDSADLLNDPQLQARNFFTQVEHAELGKTFTYLGAPYRLSETPWRIQRRAPLAGEHNLEVYEGELKLSQEQLATLKEGGIL